jgi:hypothetical protein
MEMKLSELLLKIHKIIELDDTANLEENRNKLLYKLCDSIKANNKLIDEINIKRRQRGKKVTTLCVTCGDEFKNFIIDNMTRKEYKKSVGHTHCESEHLNVIILCEIKEGLILTKFIGFSLLGI